MKALRVLFLAAALAPCLGLAEQKTKPLNFVFFLVDDLGWTDLKSFGSSFYDTPNCDRLAAWFWIGWEGAVLRAKLEASAQPLEIFAEGFFLRLQP